MAWYTDILSALRAGNALVSSGKAEDHESLTVTDTAAGFAYTGVATKAYITAEGAEMRFTLDGETTPTATVGHLLEAGDFLELNSAGDIADFLAIRTGSVNGVLKATFSEVL